MDSVRLAGRTVNRLGLSVAGLRATGMWGEPGHREEAVRVIRKAVDLGAEVLEVPVPFGPAADLVRAAEVAGVLLVARLTGRTTLQIVTSRLGRAPDLVLAGKDLLAGMGDWPVPLGVVGDEVGDGLAAVRGLYPAPPAVIGWCEAHAVPYMATETAVLQAGRHTIAVPAVRSVTEVERLFAEAAAIPPAGGPG